MIKRLSFWIALIVLAASDAIRNKSPQRQSQAFYRYGPLIWVFSISRDHGPI